MAPLRPWANVPQQFLHKSVWINISSVEYLPSEDRRSLWICAVGFMFFLSIPDSLVLLKTTNNHEYSTLLLLVSIHRHTLRLNMLISILNIMWKEQYVWIHWIIKKNSTGDDLWMAVKRRNMLDVVYSNLIHTTLYTYYLYLWISRYKLNIARYKLPILRKKSHNCEI